MMTSFGDGMIFTSCGFLVIKLSSRTSGCFPMPMTSTWVLASRNGCEALLSGILSKTRACSPVVINTTILMADCLDCESC